MGIEKIDAYICTCDNCGEVYDNGDFIPSAGDEVEIDDIVRNDGDWIKDNGKYYCQECYELDDDGYPTINESRTKDYSIGDIVPYKNTRGNVKLAEITSFKTVDNGKVWFNGIDTITKAKVWYPVHISKTLKP